MEASVRCSRCGLSLVVMDRDAAAAGEVVVEDYADHLVKHHGIEPQRAAEEASSAVRVRPRPDRG